jgi:histone demethylase JARID1
MAVPLHRHLPTLPPIANTSDSPAMRATVALNATLQGDATPNPPTELPRPAMSSGFTAVNSGGFTAVNNQTPQAPPAQPPAPSPLAAVNTPNGFHREHVESRTATPLRNGGSPMLSAHNTPDLRPAAVGLTPLSSGQMFNQLKRTLSQDAEDSSNADTDENGRRSKRLKKGKHTCACGLALPAARTGMSCQGACSGPGTGETSAATVIGQESR